MRWIRLSLGLVLAVTAGIVLGYGWLDGDALLSPLGTMTLILGVLTALSALLTPRRVDREADTATRRNGAGAPPLGEMLVNYGLITEADLERALEQTPVAKRPALEEMIGLGRFVLYSIRTTIHMKQWWLLKQELWCESDPARAGEILARMVALAEEEIANAEATIPLVEADSRLGWEPTMEYMADRAHLEWKIAVTRRVIEHEIPDYRRSLGLTQGP